MRAALLLSWLASLLPGFGGESWETALARMPLQNRTPELNRTNCVELVLKAFQSNDTVKALIFMPGATDEFYMFRRARAQLLDTNPSLLDAIVALTNQTLIRVTWRVPFLLLHTDEDPLEPAITVDHQPTAEKLRHASFLPHALFIDRDWDSVQPVIKQRFHLDVRPWRHSYDSWHFYRHSFAAWSLSGWEALEAIALAGKTTFAVERHRLVFAGDERVRATPHLEQFPR